jgi:hypothetical protein
MDSNALMSFLFITKLFIDIDKITVKIKKIGVWKYYLQKLNPEILVKNYE